MGGFSKLFIDIKCYNCFKVIKLNIYRTNNLNCYAIMTQKSEKIYPEVQVIRYHLIAPTFKYKNRMCI